MVKVMKKKPTLSAPKIFKVPDVKEGDKVVIHMLKSNQKFIHLTFKEKFTPVHVYDFEAMINYNIEKFRQNKPVVEFFQKVEQKIVFLDGVYSSYNYLFTLVRNKPYLLSITIGNMSLGFETVRQIAQKLEVKTLPFNWSGTYTFTTWAVFCEDIFVQGV